MAIKDLKPNSGNVNLTLEVVSKESPRTFEKFGKSGRVCNAKVKDDTGELKLTLWNDEIDQVSVGDKIQIQNGWCSDYKGELQLSAGKFGKIEIMGKGSAPDKISKPEMKSTIKPISSSSKSSSKKKTSDDEATPTVFKNFEDEELSAGSEEDVDVVDEEEMVE